MPRHPRPAPALAAGSDLPLSVLAGVGPAVAEKLAARGMANLQDLWLHLPRGYEDRTALTAIRDLRPGVAAQVEGTVEAVERGFRYRPMLRVALSDDTRGTLILRFFHFRAATGRPVRAGRAHPRLRDAARGPARTGDRASQLPPPRRRRALARRGAGSGVSGDRGHWPGQAAPVDRARPATPARRRCARIVAARLAARDVAADPARGPAGPALAAAGCRCRRLAAGPASGATAARAGGTAGAPAQPAPATPRPAGRGHARAGRRRTPRRTPARGAAVRADQRAGAGVRTVAR